MVEKFPFSRKGMKYHTRKRQPDTKTNTSLLQEAGTNPTDTKQLNDISKGHQLSTYNFSTLYYAQLVSYINFLLIYADYVDMGDAEYVCKTCKAILWYAEAAKGNTSTDTDAYSLCCMNAKIELPNLHHPPQVLLKLYKGEDDESKYFIKHIRKLNMMFSFTSMGGKVDNTYNKGGTPYIYRMHGQNYHAIGSLLPECGEIPRFSQLYIYDTDNEVENRILAYKYSLYCPQMLYNHFFLHVCTNYIT